MSAEISVNRKALRDMPPGLYDDWVRTAQVTRLEACLRSALAPPEVNNVVVGVDSVAHLILELREKASFWISPELEARVLREAGEA